MKIFRPSHFRRRTVFLRGIHRTILTTSAAIILGWFAPPVPSAHSAAVNWQGDISAGWGAGIPGTDTNWLGNPLPAAGDSLVFDLTTVGVANLSTTNDLTGLVLGGTNAITFTNDAGTGIGFTLAGNDVTLGGNITSTGTTGTHTHTIALDLILNGNRTVTTVTGTTIAIDGLVSETGGARNFIKTGAGTVTLSAANSFTGAISINQGLLSVNSIADGGVASAIGAGSVVNLGSGNNVAGTLNYTGSSASTNRAVNLAATTVGGAIINSNGSGALTFTGPTTVNGGTLVVSGSLSGTTSVNVNGGTLLLGAANRISNSADVVLGGGTFSSGSFSEGDALNAGLGAFVLAASSMIDFGAGNGSLLHFGSVGAHTGGGVLSLLNFDGSGNSGDDRLIFSGSASAFTSVYAQAEVNFNGTPGYAAIQFDVGNFEIVPVPEPAATGLLGAAGLCALLGWRERRRLPRRCPARTPETCDADAVR